MPTAPSSTKQHQPQYFFSKSGDRKRSLSGAGRRGEESPDGGTQMMNVLDLLKYRLGQGGQPVVPGMLPPELAPRQQAWEAGPRSYAEGELMPPRQPMASDVRREFETHDPDAPTARNDQLEAELFYNRIFPRYDIPLAEGQKRPGLGEPRAMYPSPLNQFMQRNPFALY